MIFACRPGIGLNRSGHDLDYCLGPDLDKSIEGLGSGFGLDPSQVR